MDDQRTKIAEEVAALRETQGMTFKAIGELYQLSPGKVSYLYQDFLRKRRAARYRELYEAQNQILVSLQLPLGEVDILLRIISFYQNRIRLEQYRKPSSQDPLFRDPDYATAEHLRLRLTKLSRQIRDRVQDQP